MNLGGVVLRESFLGTGVVKPELKAELSALLKSEVRNVEEASDTLMVVVKGAYSREGVEELRENYGKEVRVARVRWLERLMLGLLGEDEGLLDIGFLESLKFLDGELTVSTSLKDARAVRYVKFGYLRIGEDGQELGRRVIGAF